jgi:RNA polymerase sigma-70 factor (ECF subfamily)
MIAAIRPQAARSREGTLRAVAGGWMASTHQDPDVAVLGYEHEQLVRDLNTLPWRRRLVMAWHMDGFNTIEISEELGMAPATVRSHLRHARSTLKALFQERSQEEGEPR